MSDIQEHMRWLRDAGGRTNMEALRAIEALLARAEKAEAEVAWLLTQVSGLRDREAELLAEVDRWRNNSDNSQLQVGDLEAQTASMQRWIDHHNQRADKAERILEEGVRMAAAMNMTAGWVDSAKQILGGKS